MTLNYRGLKYEVTAKAAAVAPRKGIYRGASVDFAQIKAQPSAGQALTYRGSAYNSVV